MTQAVIGGIPVRITKKRIRHLHLYVKPPDGRVEATAPAWMSNREILAFLESREGWIREKHEEIARRPQPSEKQYTTGEKIPLWGEWYTLQVNENSRYTMRLTEDGKIAFFTVRAGSDREHREAWLHEWYRDQLAARLEERLALWSRITGLIPDSWQIKNMKTRWGTCNPGTGKLWFNLQLASRPPEALDYVVLHELAHLRVRDHGREFQAILDRYMPDWRMRKKRLNQSQMFSI